MVGGDEESRLGETAGRRPVASSRSRLPPSVDMPMVMSRRCSPSWREAVEEVAVDLLPADGAGGS